MKTMKNSLLVTVLLFVSVGLNAGPREETFLKAAKSDNLILVKRALKMGVHIDTKDNSGETALIWAVKNQKEELVRLLLTRGANVDIRDTSGKSAYAWALEINNSVIANLIINN